MNQPNATHTTTAISAPAESDLIHASSQRMLPP